MDANIYRSARDKAESLLDALIPWAQVVEESPHSHYAADDEPATDGTSTTLCVFDSGALRAAARREGLDLAALRSVTAEAEQVAKDSHCDELESLASNLSRHLHLDGFKSLDGVLARSARDLEYRILPEMDAKAIDSPPGVKGKKKAKRKRGTKQDTELKTYAALVHKAQNPSETEEQCAKAADIPRSTLHGRPEWQEWYPKVEKAAASGKLFDVQAAIDKKIGSVDAVSRDAENDLT